MSPTPPTLNPSQTVERIREIIVGRHLERLEGRVARLESSPAVSAPPALDQPLFEDRLLITEAKVEALQNHLQRMENTREDTLQVTTMHREEAQRLATQIQEIAREKAAANVALPAVENLERKLGTWLADWQKSLQSHLQERDQKVLAHVKTELNSMRDELDQRISGLESKVPDNMEDRFNRIASAANTLAESAAAFSTATHPKA
ncbi:MAG: hypothetical protein ACSHX7_04320 [Luteolibacter sp.]